MTETDSKIEEQDTKKSDDQSKSSKDFKSIVKRGSDIQIKAIGVVFILIDILLVITIIFSLILLIIFYCTHLDQIDFLSNTSNLNLQNFIMTFTPIIEFILFITILAIICAGIYISIIHRIFIDSNLSLSELIPETVKFFGLPFLTMVGSLFAVSILNIIMSLYKKSHIDHTSISQNEYLFNFGLIICIVLSILALSVLIKVEHLIQNQKEESEKISSFRNGAK